MFEAGLHDDYAFDGLWLRLRTYAVFNVPDNRSVSDGSAARPSPTRYQMGPGRVGRRQADNFDADNFDSA
jgi:hypothetical protein